MQEPDSGAAQSRSIVRVREGVVRATDDLVVVEAPLEIRVVADGVERAATVTMRTPGDDASLAVGFLHAEGIVRGAADVATLAPCPAREGVLRVTLVPGCRVDFGALARNFTATSSCGLCGSASLDAVLAKLVVDRSAREGGEPFRVAAAVLRRLPEALRAAQPTFEATGGLHAVAAFDATGRLLDLREDVGRHNALDKLVGAALLRGEPRLQDCVVVLSGRAGVEMLQKAVAAGVPVLAAIGAPSSLAVELAERAGVTLVGFLRDSGFNVYSGAGRIAGVGAVRVAAAAAELVDEP